MSVHVDQRKEGHEHDRVHHHHVQRTAEHVDVVDIKPLDVLPPVQECSVCLGTLRAHLH